MGDILLASFNCTFNCLYMYIFLTKKRGCFGWIMVVMLVLTNVGDGAAWVGALEGKCVCVVVSVVAKDTQ